jgi:16S rRNA (guanine966-N2)-methyltransferase
MVESPYSREISMRIIAGAARGRRLTTLKGQNTRPTTDRVREALFSILYSNIGGLDGKRVLDLFAGSGALAIEALSRGASHAWLVEKSPQALQIIQKNLQSCRYSEDADIINMDAWQALNTLKATAPFDLIFIDPPYRKGLALQALEMVETEGLLSDNGIVCVETAATESLPEQTTHLWRYDHRRYGSTALHFYSQPRQEPS